MPQTDMSNSKRISLELLGQLLEPEQIAWFKIDKCIGIKEDGDYELEIRPRLLKENGEKPVHIPTP